ncbi:hypothetical protein BH23CHL2_BH23CHL2_22650 [soil metagenome]
MTETNTQDLTFRWNDLELAGTLHCPDASDPHPAVLMMQGSGPADRDSNGYFPPIREAFLQRGIATFAFDKPGIGESTGDWRDHGFDDRAGQALAALDLMRDHPSIDGERVGIWGHSQGGWLAQILAARLPDLHFAIANSGPSINPQFQDKYGCEHTMRAEGHSEEEIEQALVFLDAVHDAARRGDDYETVQADLLHDARQHSWYGYLTLEDAETWSFIARSAAERYEPVKALSRIRCPFLAIYGAQDLLVPAWQSARESSDALHKSGNSDATIVVFPQGDHRIRDAATDDFATGYLDLLGDWTARRAGST